MHKRLIGNVPSNNRRGNARKFRDKERSDIYFIRDKSAGKSVAAKEKRDKEKDQIKRENPQIGEALT